MGPGSEGGEDTSLVTQRYLDSEGEPVEVTGSVEPSQFGTEYKRLPVRLILHMDQRWLYQLISACANAPLQVEVQEVRINPLDGNQRGRNRRMYDLTSGRRNLGFGRNSGRSGNINVNIFDRRTHIVPVVIQGVIYIFNEPDLEALTIAEDSA